MKTCIQSLQVNSILAAATSKGEIFLKGFLVSMNRMLQNQKKTKEMNPRCHMDTFLDSDICHR